MYAVVRLRGNVSVKYTVEDTLQMLRLNKVNHCIVLDENPYNLGMVQKVKDYVAYGTINSDTLTNLLEKRGKIEGGVQLTDEYVAENTEYDSIASFAEAVCNNEATLKDVPKLKPVLRLHPPRKGHRGIKKTVQQRGELGNHGENINALLHKMR